MKFRFKLIFTYIIFMLMISLLIGVVSYRFSMSQYQESANETMQDISSQIMQQFDAKVKPMLSACDFILSDAELINALQVLAHGHQLEYSEDKMIAARRVVESKLNDNYIRKEFYRIVVFNKYGDIIFGKNYAARRVDENKDVSDITWLAEVENQKGKAVLLAAHEDNWGYHTWPVVFSIGKEILGMNMGFIEVQVEQEELHEISETVPLNTQYAIVNKAGKLIYNTSDISIERIEELMDMKDGVYKIKEQNEIIAKCTSKNTQAITFVIDDLDSIEKEAMGRLLLPFCLAAGFFFLSVIFVSWSSKRLTMPLRKLQFLMNETEIENLNENIISETNQNDEIEALYVAYQRTKKRLNESLIKEQKMSLLHLQAQFDALQAQVNPHFLYNVLNVISSRGLLLEDEVVCEICSSLAIILRYSTNTKERYALITEEMEYLYHYYYLLKVRYEHKIVFDMHVDDNLEDVIIPKMVLQQIVENSIEHGFVNTKGQMRITLRGSYVDNGWEVEIVDNGQGIAKETYSCLTKKMQIVREKIMNKTENVELEIGGMGLVNTYARLWLMYRDAVVFKIVSSEKGTSITIGVKKEENMNV